MPARSTNITVSIPVNQLDAIEANAREARISRAEWIRRAVSQVLSAAEYPAVRTIPNTIAAALTDPEPIYLAGVEVSERSKLQATERALARGLAPFTYPSQSDDSLCALGLEAMKARRDADQAALQPALNAVVERLSVELAEWRALAESREAAHDQGYREGRALKALAESRKAAHEPQGTAPTAPIGDTPDEVPPPAEQCKLTPLDKALQAFEEQGIDIQKQPPRPQTR